MRNVIRIYRKLRFCQQFGANLKDKLKLMKLTIDYSVAVRSKSKRIEVQMDQKIHKIEAFYNGKRFPLHFRQQDISMLFEVWMQQSYNISLYEISKGIIVDLGAHVGFTTLYLWTQLGDDRHYVCVEGSTKNASILRKNLNIISHTSIHESIITSDGRKVNFYDEVAGHLHQIHEHKGKSQNSTALFDLLRFYKDQAIAICKMDVEGIEIELLSQNNTWLDEVRLLFLELHDHSQLDQISNTILKRNFRLGTNGEIIVFNKN